MSDYKQCLNGHYYQGDTCPFCAGKTKDSITIGRSLENDIIVNDYKVTRTHCRIERVGEDRYRIIDLQSENGTYVNGKRLEVSMEISPFDIIRVGDTNVQWLHHFDSLGRESHLSGDITPHSPSITMGLFEPTLSSPSPQTPDDDNNNNAHTPEPTVTKWEYHKCPNGHYYKGDGTCPFCPSSKQPKKEKKDDELKVCHNLHAYDAKLNKCPFCDSSIVIDKFICKRTDTIELRFIHFSNPIQVKIGNKELFDCEFIRVSLPHGYTNDYCFSDKDNWQSEVLAEIKPGINILFGETEMSGKELIRLCDLILENNLSNRDYSTVNVKVDDLIQLNELIKRVTREQSQDMQL